MLPGAMDVLALNELLEEFSRAQYRVRDSTGPKVEKIERECLELFGKDYCYSLIQNVNGELCGHYPRQIVVLEYESTEQDKDTFESTVQVSRLQDLVNRSKMARCRSRFVCPVILYKGKHICRSATLAGWGELYGRTGYNYIFSGGSDDAWADTEEVSEDAASGRNGDSQLFDKVRGQDIKLLRYLSVKYICDLMVENKKVKFGLNVTSSEKVDKAQRYADFTLLSIPYPGCEFFKDYKDRDYSAEGLVFNWKQDFVDAPLSIPVSLTQSLNIDWSEYQCWDLVKQTQNYLKLLIHIINNDDDSGLLVHCISGWDRTPLFVSLLRLSLWADGLIHSSLDPTEILYLTVAYDWFFFGHMLADRLCKGEDIFFFCFNFLKHITSDEFAACGSKTRRKSPQPHELGFMMEDFCALKQRDQGSATSLCSDFSIVAEDSPGGAAAAGVFSYETVELSAGAQSQAAWRKTCTSSPQTALCSRPQQLEERLLYPAVTEHKSSSSSSSNHSDHLLIPEYKSSKSSSPSSNHSDHLAATEHKSSSPSNHSDHPAATEHKSSSPSSNHSDHPAATEHKSSSPSSLSYHSDHFRGVGSSPLEVPQRRSADHSLPGSSVSTDFGSWQMVSEGGSIHDQGILSDTPPPCPFQEEHPNGHLRTERESRLEAVRSILLAAYSTTIGLKSVSPSSGAISGLLEQFARGVGLRGAGANV